MFKYQQQCTKVTQFFRNLFRRSSSKKKVQPNSSPCPQYPDVAKPRSGRGLPWGTRKEEGKVGKGAGGKVTGAVRAGNDWLARNPGHPVRRRSSPRALSLCSPCVWSIYCRGEEAAAQYPEQQSTKDGARASGAPSNGPGREFHGDWGARPPHHHPCPPAYPSRPT